MLPDASAVQYRIAAVFGFPCRVPRFVVLIHSGGERKVQASAQKIPKHKLMYALIFFSFRPIDS